MNTNRGRMRRAEEQPMRAPLYVHSIRCHLSRRYFSIRPQETVLRRLATIICDEIPDRDLSPLGIVELERCKIVIAGSQSIAIYLGREKDASPLAHRLCLSAFRRHRSYRYRFYVR